MASWGCPAFPLNTGMLCPPAPMFSLPDPEQGSFLWWTRDSPVFCYYVLEIQLLGFPQLSAPVRDWHTTQNKIPMLITKESISAESAHISEQGWEGGLSPPCKGSPSWALRAHGAAAVLCSWLMPACFWGMSDQDEKRKVTLSSQNTT